MQTRHGRRVQAVARGALRGCDRHLAAWLIARTDHWRERRLARKLDRRWIQALGPVDRDPARLYRPGRSLRKPHRLSALACDATAFRLFTLGPDQARRRRSGQADARVALFNGDSGWLPARRAVSAAFADEPARRRSPRRVDLTPIKSSDGHRDHHPGACTAVGAWVRWTEWTVRALEAEAQPAPPPQML